MNGNSSLEDILYDPETVDFIVKYNDYFLNFLNERPYIRFTRLFNDQYIIGYINRAYVQQLIEDLGTGIVGATPLILGLLGRDSLEAAGIIQVQEQPFLDLRGSGILVGIVDTGIDYTSNSFRYEDGTTKIQFLFDMTIRTTPPEGFYIGTEYTKEQIDLALQSENPYDIVPSQDTVGHGTFLASIAAGRQNAENPDIIGAAPEAELIIVKLKTARPYLKERFLIPPDQENAFESTAVMVGIDYIIKKSQQLKRPVAICLGVGTNMGGHDGYSLFEEYIGNVSNLGGVCICTAAGNESDAKHHTQGTISREGESVPIDISVGQNAGSIYMQIWNSASDRFSVAIRSPTGEFIGRVPAKTGTFFQVNLVLERAKVSVEYYFPVERSGSQLTVVKLIDATPGLWTVLVYGDIVLDGTFHAWLPITGFVSPNVEFTAPSPNYTIVVPATSFIVITCGAYNNFTNSLYPRTSWGPTRLPRISPDFVAPGVNVSGVFPTGPGIMSGTSVSAAITTGACALLLQWGIIEGNDPYMSTSHAKAFLIRGCVRDKNLAYPNVQWGYGRLNLIQAFNLMRGQ
ncbi:MAG: hypothetical protein A2Y15_03240 [Clostridiales bacterium GWF2_36_10]|nr:MAG: hypothetical protein A2Y15_03240 [Clostridiales bacterium GWF2_36_10]